MKQKRRLQGDKDRKGGCSRRGTKTEKVAAAGIVGKANPKEKEKEEKEEDIERDNIAEETEGSF